MKRGYSLSTQHRYNKDIFNTTASERNKSFVLNRNQRSLHGSRGAVTIHYQSQSFSDSYESEKFVFNKQQIRKLKGCLRSLNVRKSQIQNPEYSVDLDEDIEAWKSSINVAKNEMESLWSEQRPRIIRKHRFSYQHKQLYKTIQQEIKNRNALEQKLAKAQKQIEYFKCKNNEATERIFEIQKEHNRTFYLIKLKQIQFNKQSTRLRKDLFQSKYWSIKEEVGLVEETIERDDKKIRSLDHQLEVTNSIIRSLLMQCYSSNG